MKLLLDKKVLKGWLSIARVIGEDVPAWGRSVVVSLAFLAMICFYILVFPVLLIQYVFFGNRINPFAKLRNELETKWDDNCAFSALQQLREIDKELQTNIHKLFIGGYTILPYGKFNIYDAIHVEYMLFHWEFDLGCYAEAEKICERVIQRDSDNNKRIKSTYAKWIINKAKVINKSRGNTAAQEFLLQYVDVRNLDNPVNVYFAALKGEN